MVAPSGVSSNGWEMYLTSWKPATVTIPHSRQPRELATYSPGHSPWKISQHILFLKVNFCLFTPGFYTPWGFNEQRKPASRSLDSVNRNLFLFAFRYLQARLPIAMRLKEEDMILLPSLPFSIIYRDQKGQWERINICKNENNKYLLSICFVSKPLSCIFHFHNSLI